MGIVNEVHIIEDYEGDQVEPKVEDSLAFLKGMKLIFNDGSGDKELITFESIDFVDGMQQKCRIRKEDGSITTVYPDSIFMIRKMGFYQIKTSMFSNWTKK